MTDRDEKRFPRRPRTGLVLLNFVAWCLVAHCGGGTVRAGGGPESVLLVVNQNHATSLLIANHYAAWRHIPATNIVYLDNIPNGTVISLEQFKNRILHPIFEAVRSRGLAGQIDYIVYSDGFPTAVTINAHIRQMETQLRGDRETEVDLGRMFNPRASLTALTYFAAAVLADEPAYLALDANWYYRGPAGKLLAEPFRGQEQEAYQRSLAALEDERFDEALETLTGLNQRHPQQVAVAYQLARAYAAIDDLGLAAQWLARAVQAGWMYRSIIEQDPLFEKALRDRSFQQLVRRIGNESLDFAPTHSFRSTYCWAPTGSINSTPDQGRHYLLSTMLAITCANGNSEQESLDQLRASVAADGSRPNGKFFFALTNDVRTISRQPQLMPAIERLRALGLEAEITGRTLPQRARVAGLSIGTASFDWRSSNSLLLPGAIAENFTSLGGRFDNAGQTKLTEFLRQRAAGSSGTVIEPLAIPNKFPHAMIHVHYARGCSLAEAYYQSVSGPFQLLIAGDALCQPWAEFPKFEMPQWTPPAYVSDVIVIPLAKQSDSPPIAALEVFVDGRLVAASNWPEQMRFDTSSLTDGFHELRLVAVGLGPIHTRSRILVPLWIDNHGAQIELTCSSTEHQVSDTIEFTYRSSVGTQFELRQGARRLQLLRGPSGRASLPAAKLGRGPASVQLVAIDADGREYASRPVQLEIKGPISNIIPDPTPTNPQRRGRRNS